VYLQVKPNQKKKIKKKTSIMLFSLKLTIFLLILLCFCDNVKTDDDSDEVDNKQIIAKKFNGRNIKYARNVPMSPKFVYDPRIGKHRKLVPQFLSEVDIQIYRRHN